MRNKRSYGKYNKFDVVFADFGRKPHGVEGGIRPGIIISCDESNHARAPQVSVSARTNRRLSESRTDEE